MTSAQLTTFRTDILANIAVIAAGLPFAGTQVKNLPNNSDGWDACAGWYNLLVAVDYYVWRTNVTEEEFVSVTGVDVANGNAATNWAWTGSGFITRSQGERDCWARIFQDGFCNPSLANVRQAFSDIISGATAPAPANRNHMLVIAKRKATNIEKLLATGNGAFATPSLMAFEGLVSSDDVRQALD